MKKIIIRYAFFVVAVAIIGSSCSSRTNNPKVETFIRGFVAATRENPESAQKYLAKGVSEQTNSWHPYFTEQYELQLLDYSWGIYEYSMTFDNGSVFVVEVKWDNGSSRIVGLRRCLPKQTPIRPEK